MALRVDCSTEVDLLVSRFEVTRGEWQRAEAAEGSGRLELPAAFNADWTPETEDWPASGMTRHQAREFAEAQGMRLPSAREWMRTAAGSRAQYYPWGTRAQDSAANTLELGLLRAAPVGTFQNGRTFAGVFDMLGNVWEWVEPPTPAGPGFLLFTGPYDGGSPGASPAWAMGGSFLTRARPLWRAGTREGVSLLAQDLDARHRAGDLGLRCVAGAEGYLRAHARDWSEPRWRARLVSVGKSWGRSSVRLLEELAGESDAPAALDWLLEGARR